MLADPVAGESYRQEYYEDEAEDLGEVFQVGQSETVPTGSFDDIVVMVGVVLERVVEGGDGVAELIEFTAGS